MPLRRLVSTVILSCLGAAAPAATNRALAQEPSNVTVVVGTVTEVGAGLLEGVFVEAIGGFELPTITLPNGVYLIAGQRTDEADLVLRFSKDGFVRRLETIPLSQAALGLVRRDTSLKRAGAPQEVALDTGGVATEDESAVMIEPGDCIRAWAIAAWPTSSPPRDALNPAPAERGEGQSESRSIAQASMSDARRRRWPCRL